MALLTSTPLNRSTMLGTSTAVDPLTMEARTTAFRGTSVALNAGETEATAGGNAAVVGTKIKKVGRTLLLAVTALKRTVSGPPEVKVTTALLPRASVIGT